MQNLHNMSNGLTNKKINFLLIGTSLSMEKKTFWPNFARQSDNYTSCLEKQLLHLKV